MLHRSLSFGGARALASVGLAAALNGVFLAAFFGSGKVVYAMALAFLPIAALAFGALVASDQSILAFAALGFGVSINVFQAPLVGQSVFAADALAVLAITVWVSARLLGKNTARRPAIAPGLRGAGALFVFFWGIALIRGHEHFGQKLYGPAAPARPLRRDRAVAHRPRP